MRYVPMKLSVRVFDIVLGELLGRNEITEFTLKDHELRRYGFYYVNHVVVMSLHKNGRIVILFIYSGEMIAKSFEIADYAVDDSLSLIVCEYPCKPYRMLIIKNMLARAIIATVLHDKISDNMIYKNMPKMKSSQYGSRLHDISIVCHDD